MRPSALELRSHVGAAGKGEPPGPPRLRPSWLPGSPSASQPGACWELRRRMNGSRMGEEQSTGWVGGCPRPRPGCSPGKAEGHGGTVTDGPWEWRQRPVLSDRLHLHQLAKGRLHPAASTGPRGDQAASRPPGAQLHQGEGASSLAGLREEGRDGWKVPVWRLSTGFPVWSGPGRWCHATLTGSCSRLPPPKGN